MNPTPSGKGHETRDVALRPLLLFAGGLMGLTVLAFLCMAWLFEYLEGRMARSDVPPAISDVEPLTPPAPRLQIDPARELQRQQQAEREVLDSYGWIDPRAGLARIPIRRAIDLMAARGLPVRRTQAAAEDDVSKEGNP